MAQKPNSTDATRPPADGVLSDIAEYVLDYQVRSDEAEATARLALMDAPGGTFYSLGNAQCTRALGPVVAGADVSTRRNGLSIGPHGTGLGRAGHAVARGATSNLTPLRELCHGESAIQGSLLGDEFVSRLVI